MKITPAQARQAFYQAAANIEARPDLYDFYRAKVGDPDCSTCMWGHVGRALAMDHNTTNIGVALALGFSDVGRRPPTAFLYEACTDAFDAIAAAQSMRDFADHHWPEGSTEPVRPDLVECGQSFTELMAELRGEVA